MKNLCLLTAFALADHTHILKPKLHRQEKHIALADTSINYTSRKHNRSLVDMVKEDWLGYDLTSAFEHKVNQFLADNMIDSAARSKRLRQTISHEQTYGVSIPMFTGEIIMGNA